MPCVFTLITIIIILLTFIIYQPVALKTCFLFLVTCIFLMILTPKNEVMTTSIVKLFILDVNEIHLSNL